MLQDFLRKDFKVILKELEISTVHKDWLRGHS